MRARIIAIVVSLLLMVGCSISEKQEIEMGREMHGQFEKQFGGLYPDQPIQQYVNTVGMKMAAEAGRANLPWQFRVLNADEINAFAVPGGYVYVTSGLLFRLQNEAQLAGVLGHEAAHVAHRHSVKQLEKARAAQGGAIVADIVGGIFGVGGVGDVAGLVASLALMKYGRDQEEEADMSGMKYMTAYGYSPQGMVQTMTILQEASGRGGPPEFLSTHPNPGNRIEYLNETIDKRYPRLAENGFFGTDDFRQNVLQRRRVALRLIELRDPQAWCLVCQSE